MSSFISEKLSTFYIKKLIYTEITVLDGYGRCRWSMNANDPLLFLKFGLDRLNILHIEKKAVALKYSIYLEQKGKYSLLYAS